MLCGTSNWPGPVPLPPHHWTNMPCLVKRATRVFGPSPSAIRMSPFFSIATSAMPLKASFDSLPPVTPFLPNVIRSLPCGLNSNACISPPIGDPDIARTVDAEKMGGLEHVPAPAAEEFAVAIEDHDRHRLIPMEHVNVVVAVDIYTGSRSPPGDPGRKLRPILDHAIVGVCCLSCHAM